MQLRVRQARWEADGVMELTLVDPAGLDLPAWQPGAHVDVLLPSGLIRQYSLCGDPKDLSAYRIAVLHEPRGRGGSREVHETPLVGKLLGVRGPRNHFPLVPADRYLFVAGGIGITPILAMVRQLSQDGGPPWALVYGGRSLGTMAYLEEARALDGGSTTVVPQDTAGLPDLDTVLGSALPGTAVYCCGPEGLLRAVEERCAGRPEVDLHVERFAAPSSVAGAEPAQQNTVFQVELRRSGLTLPVPADRTILDVVRDVLPEALSSCEEGFCGTCETPVLEGTPDHRDTILTDREHEEGRLMMICVSRSRTQRLVLDL